MDLPGNFGEKLDRMELEREFERTGLPKGALAGMLGVTKAIVTRLVSWDGKRDLQPGEQLSARAFFALVPLDVDLPFRRAVHLMKRSEKLIEVSKLLAFTDLTSAFGIVIQTDPLNLRADHIVHACRIGRIDLERLVKDGRVVPETDQSRLSLFDPLVDKFYQRADAGEFLPPDRRTFQQPKILSLRAPGGNSTVPSENATSHHVPSAAVELSKEVASLPSDALLPGMMIDTSVLRTCSALVIADDSLEPRYSRGETILVTPIESGHRQGDDVLVETVDRGRIVGKKLFEGREKILIEHPRDGQTQVQKTEIVSIRRIAFVVR
jgi:hypothetical protein